MNNKKTIYLPNNYLDTVSKDDENKIIKILIVINSVKRGGGAEKVAFLLFKTLLKKNCDVYILSFYKSASEYEIPKERIIYFNNSEGNYHLFKDILLSILRARKIAEICRRKKIDVIIPFMEIEGCTSIISKLIFKINAKIFPTFHTNPRQYSKNKIKKIILSKLYSKAECIVAICNKMSKLLKDIFNLKNVIVIPNLHDINEYILLSKETLEKKYNVIFRDSFIFINVGGLTVAKGQWFLIRAFKKVVEKHSNAKLIILGEGKLKKELEYLIKKLNLENNVFLLGIHNNPFKFLKNSHCYVFPSLWEGLPNTLIEALALNLPIISTDCETGPREILAPELDIEEKIDYPYFGKYGILIKPFPRKCIFKDLEEKSLIEQEKQLAELMIRMIEDKELRKRYSYGLERAKDFHSEVIINKWIELFKE